MTWSLIKKAYKNNHGEELEVEPIDISKKVAKAHDPEEVIRVITVKWGTKYDAEYVNKVYKGMKRYTKRDFKFICFTDDAEGLNENIEPKELLENWTGWWGKATIFAKAHGFDTGLNYFIDLDMIISGPLDDLFKFDGSFALLRTDEIQNECLNKGGYNSSIVYWRGSEFCQIYELLKKAKTEVESYLFRYFSLIIY